MNRTGVSAGNGTMVLQRADERGAEARDRFMIERVFAGLAANTIRTEESGHAFT